MTVENPIACALTSSELPDRIESARSLGERALVGLAVEERRALLRFDGARDEVDALVAAESRCCPFFEFDTRQTDGRVELEIVTPEGGEPLLRGLVAGLVAGWEGGLR